jgi:hypothetical protein
MFETASAIVMARGLGRDWWGKSKVFPIRMGCSFLVFKPRKLDQQSGEQTAIVPRPYEIRNHAASLCCQAVRNAPRA